MIHKDAYGSHEECLEGRSTLFTTIEISILFPVLLTLIRLVTPLSISPALYFDLYPNSEASDSKPPTRALDTQLPVSQAPTPNSHSSWLSNPPTHGVLRDIRSKHVRGNLSTSYVW